MASLEEMYDSKLMQIILPRKSACIRSLLRVSKDEQRDYSVESSETPLETERPCYCGRSSPSSASTIVTLSSFLLMVQENHH